MFSSSDDDELEPMDQTWTPPAFLTPLPDEENLDWMTRSADAAAGASPPRPCLLYTSVLDPSKDGAYCAATQDDDRNKCPKSSETPPAPIDFVPGFVGGRRQHSSAGRKSFFFSRVNVEGPCISFCWSLGMIQEA